MRVPWKFLSLFLFVATDATTVVAFQQQLPRLVVGRCSLPTLSTSAAASSGSVISADGFARNAAAMEVQQVNDAARHCPFAFKHVQLKLKQFSTTRTENGRQGLPAMITSTVLKALFNLKHRMTRPMILGLCIYWNLKQGSTVPIRVENAARRIAGKNSSESQYLDTMYRILKKKRRFTFVGGISNDPSRLSIEKKLYYVTRVLAQEFAVVQFRKIVPTFHSDFSQEYYEVATLFWKGKNGMTYDQFLLDPRSTSQGIDAIRSVLGQFEVNTFLSLTNHYYYPNDEDIDSQKGIKEDEDPIKSSSFAQLQRTHQGMDITDKGFNILRDAAREVIHRVLEDALHSGVISIEKRDELTDFFMKRFTNDFTRKACVGS